MYECKYKIKKNKMENLSLSSSDKESDNECDNESDKGSEVSLIINFLRIKTVFFIIWTLIVYYHILVIHY